MTFKFRRRPENHNIWLPPNARLRICRREQVEMPADPFSEPCPRSSLRVLCRRSRRLEVLVKQLHCVGQDIGVDLRVGEKEYPLNSRSRMILEKCNGAHQQAWRHGVKIEPGLARSEHGKQHAFEFLF